MRRLIVTAIALFAIAGFEQTTAGQGGGCDRACLTGIAEQYIAAVIAKTPDKAGLATNARMTENGQDLPIGEALWNSASGRGEYTLHVADPVLGSIVTFATMREGDRGSGIGDWIRDQGSGTGGSGIGGVRDLGVTDRGAGIRSSGHQSNGVR